MQLQIDAGLQWCPPCETFGWHAFCGRCGRRYVGGDLTWRECPQCDRIVSTDYCPVCGASVADDFIRSLEDGTLDVAAEEKIAAGILEKFYKAQPQWAPTHWQERQPASLRDALLERFG